MLVAPFSLISQVKAKTYNLAAGSASLASSCSSGDATGMTIEYASTAILITVLAYVIVDDLLHFRIKNSVIILLGLLSFTHLLAQPNLNVLLWHSVFAVFGFGLLIIAYLRGLIGGGDTKLLAVAFFWTGHETALTYSIFMFLLTLGYWAGAKFGPLPSQSVGGRLKIPFGPSIAGAWAITAMVPIAVSLANTVK